MSNSDKTSLSNQADHLDIEDHMTCDVLVFNWNTVITIELKKASSIASLQNVVPICLPIARASSTDLGNSTPYLCNHLQYLIFFSLLTIRSHFLNT
jgi:hypothetical protein